MPDSNHKRPFELEDLFRFQFINEAQISPNGKLAVYTLSRLDAEKDQEFSELWLIDLENSRNIPLNAGDWNDSRPAWSPDGTEIAFISTRSGLPQVYQVRPHGGEARKRTSIPQGCLGPLLWSLDGQWLAFHIPPVPPVKPGSPHRINRTLYRLDGAGYVDNFFKQICVLPAGGGEPLTLTRDLCNHTASSWSPDGREILYLSNFGPDSSDSNPSICSVSLQGDMRMFLSGDWGIINHAVWLPDGRICFMGLEKKYIYGSKKDLWVMDADTSQITCRSSSLEVGVGGQLHDDVPLNWGGFPILPAADGSSVIATVQNGGAVHLYAFATRGPESHTRLTNGERNCYPFGRVGEKLLFGFSTLFDPSQLSVIDEGTKEEHVLTHLNAALHEQISQPVLEKLNFNSVDGAPVEGWVLKPEGRPPFPTILHIHGGPHYGYGYGFSFDFLTLTGAGYAVLFLNHRGSTGYGSAFATGAHGDWGNLDYHDLMTGVDHAVQLGIADPERLGCCGLSGGGNLSCWIVGHTHRFKAAVPENPLTNWFSFYGTSDIGPVFSVRELGGKLDEIPDVYLRCSPIFYAHDCKTPVLLIHGESDYRCPIEQSEQFYAVLRANGCVAEMLRFPGSTHEGATYGSLVVRKMQNEALLEWMDRYVKPERNK